MMQKNWIIKIFGLLDILLILWIFYKSYSAKKIPIYSDLQESLVSAKDFGFAEIIFSAAMVLSSIMLVSIIFSGFFMLKLKRIGIYLSLIQSPFRILLLIQPTFFFLSTPLIKLGLNHPSPFLLIVLLELGKIAFQISWLKNQDCKIQTYK